MIQLDSQISEPDIEVPDIAVNEESLREDLSPGFEVSLIEALMQLVRHRRLILMVTGSVILLGILYCLSLPTLYTSTTKIMTPQQTQSSAALLMSQLTNAGGGSLAAVTGGGLGLKNPNDQYLGLLGSRPVADAIIQEFGLSSEYQSRDMTAARKTLAGRTQMTTEKSGFLAVSVTDSDKQRAAEIANAYTEQLRIITKTLAVTEASQRRLFYEQQLQQSREALLAAELAFQQVQQQKGLIQLDAQARAMIDSLAALRAQVAAKQVEVQAMRSYATEQNPDVQLAERELSALEAEELNLEQHNQVPGIAGLGLGNVPAAGLEYVRAAHEVQYQQALFDMLMKQYDAAKLDESKDAAIIQVVEPAIAANQKSSPHRLLILIGFAIAGLLLSCVLVRILWWKNALQATPKIARALRDLQNTYAAKKTVEV
jgi:tyrosine-protein kinase Etk/Wzc